MSVYAEYRQDELAVGQQLVVDFAGDVEPEITVLNVTPFGSDSMMWTYVLTWHEGPEDEPQTPHNRGVDQHLPHPVA